MKNTQEHIVDRQIADALRGHEITPSKGVWSRLARHLPFIDAVVHLPWYYSARNVVVVLLFLSTLSFTGGYFLANWSGDGEQLLADGGTKISTASMGIDKDMTLPDEQVAISIPTESTSNASSFAASNSDTGQDLNDVAEPNNRGHVVQSTRNQSTPVQFNAQANFVISDNGLTEGDEIEDETSNIETSALASVLQLEKSVSIVSEESSAALAGVSELSPSSNDEMADGFEVKYKQPFIGWEFGLAMTAFANHGDYSLNKGLSSYDRDLLAPRNFDFSPSLTAGVTFGKYFGLRTGIGVRNMHFSQKSRVVNLYENSFDADSTTNSNPSDGIFFSTTYDNHQLQVLQIPMLLGAQYEIGKLRMELYAGTVLNKVYSVSGTQVVQDDRIAGREGNRTASELTTMPEFSSQFFNQVSLGIGYSVTPSVSLMVNPFYQFTKGDIAYPQGGFNPSSFGGTVSARIRL